MQQTPCDECGKPITDKVRLEAGISFCSEACEFEDERKSCKKLGLEPSYQLDRYDEMQANFEADDDDAEDYVLLCSYGRVDAPSSV